MGFTHNIFADTLLHPYIKSIVLKISFPSHITLTEEILILSSLAQKFAVQSKQATR